MHESRHGDDSRSDDITNHATGAARLMSVIDGLMAYKTSCLSSVTMRDH